MGFSGITNLFKWITNLFSWVFHGSETFSRGCIVGPKLSLVGISWVRNFSSWITNFLSWLFCGSEIFPRGYSVSSKFSLVCNFVIFSCWPHEEVWYRKIYWTAYSIPNWFQQLLILFILERYFIYQITYTIAQLYSVLVVFLVIPFLRNLCPCNRSI